MTDYHFPSKIRELIQDALPRDMAVFGQPPDPRYTFTPLRHSRALDPDAMLVVGMRGAGKSFWWSALQIQEHRRILERWLPGSGIKENTIVSKGFGERPSPDDYPGKDTLVQLCDRFDPRHIWRTIVFLRVVGDSPQTDSISSKSWEEKVEWVVRRPETVERLLFQADEILGQDNVKHLIIFDALERTADTWPLMLKIIRGLFQVLLEFRSYRGIRPKAFIRPDHIEDSKAVDFPDSSKILGRKVELRWPRNELYGLLWQYLCNEPRQGSLFRDACSDILKVQWEQFEDIWSIPHSLRENEDDQRKVFHAITGPWMGRDRRRGFPYTWLPNHLGDSSAQVSPRSFLAAIRHSSEDFPRSGYNYPIYYESIKRGVQEASRIRVREMQEDYPWLEVLMKPLVGLNVPCRFDEIATRWQDEKVLEHLRDDIAGALVKLPPANLGERASGVRRDLEALGIFERLSDGRVNLPDVYRVGYGLGRKGGVKAVAR